MTYRWISLTQILPGNVLKVFAIESRRITSVVRAADDTHSEICIDNCVDGKLLVAERPNEFDNPMTGRWVNLTEILPGNVRRVFVIEPRRITSVIRAADDTYSEICIDNRVDEKLLIVERTGEISTMLPPLSKARKQRLRK
jgi:hypothetical protein